MNKVQALMTSSLLPLAWMTHMASMVMHKCVTQALARSVDPRAHLNEINWEVMSERLLSGEDIKMLWYYIRKEVCALYQAGLLQSAAFLFSYSNFPSPSSPLLPHFLPSFPLPPFFPSSSLLPLLLPSPPPPLFSSPPPLPLFPLLVLFSIQTILPCQKLRPPCYLMPD